MNKDQLNSVSSIEVLRDVVAIVDRIQDYPGSRQVAAVAVTFRIYSEVLGIDPSELINKAQRIVKDADTFFTREAKALRDYVREEVK